MPTKLRRRNALVCPLAPSAEGESEGLGSGVEKLDLELPLRHGLALANQLIKPFFDDRTIAVGAGIDTVIRAGRLAIDEDAKANRLAVAGPEHEMQVARTETVGDARVGLVGDRPLLFNRPVSSKRPLIQTEIRRR
jgi:hypothetical protein